MSLHGSRGTIASPTASAGTDLLGNINFAGYDGSAYLRRASINGIIDGTVVDGSDTLPVAILFKTGTTSATERLRITSAGFVGISTITPNARLHVLSGNEAGILIEDNNTGNNAPYFEIIAKRTDANTHQSFSGQVFLSRNRTEQKISSGLKLGTVLFGGNHTNASKSNIASVSYTHLTLPTILRV